MANISKSRFAVLKIEDDDDDVSSGAVANSNQSNAVSKRKNKKKKKESDENIKKVIPGQQTGRHEHSGNGKPGKAESWDDWKHRDEEAVQDMFEKDLQQAILQSRLDFEKQLQHKNQPGSANQVKPGAPVQNKEGKKKKKQKDKPQTMSLEQFNQLPPETVPGSDEEDKLPSPPPIHTRVPVEEQNPHYFDSIRNDADKIVQKERIQEEYKKQYAQESAMASKYKETLEKKDEEIAQLKARLKQQEEELQQVKKRNKQLCVILAQGEMKDKAEALMQVEELTTVKDELTEQVASLMADLEKERSKVHAMKVENDKLKASGKHGK